MNEKFYMYVIDEYEKKLKEIMGEKEYHKFAEKVAKEGFKKEVEGMVASDFKKFCLDNFDKITE